MLQLVKLLNIKVIKAKNFWVCWEKEIIQLRSLVLQFHSKVFHGIRASFYLSFSNCNFNLVFWSTSWCNSYILSASWCHSADASIEHALTIKLRQKQLHSLAHRDGECGVCQRLSRTYWRVEDLPSKGNKFGWFM